MRDSLKNRLLTIAKNSVMISALLLVAKVSDAQNPWDALSKRPATLGIEGGMQKHRTKTFELALVKQSQTVAALYPTSDLSFDFTPGDRLDLRKGDGLYQLGDLNLRLRTSGQRAWQEFSTAKHRKAVETLKPTGNILAAANLTNTLSANIPLKINRYWEQIDGKLVLRFELHNTSDKIVEIGALGIPMIFNNILQKRTLDEAHAKNVFFDPYIGKDAGYLQVARLSGKGEALVVIPYGKTPFEAYRPLLDDPTPRGITFEGFYEWMVCSKAYAEKEWKGIEQWNEPTSVLLKPNESINYGLQFVLAENVKQVEKSLEMNLRPVTIGVPGYVLPKDVAGKLFIKYPKKVLSIAVLPKGALSFKQIKKKANLEVYEVSANTWGKARVTIRYADGVEQTIHYKVINPETQIMDSIGHFLTTKQWFNQPNDPFGRNPSVISYDYQEQKQVTQDSRAWVAGLSDEGGAGSWLEAIMKQLVQPNKAELAKLQEFVQQTLWGNIQHSEGSQKYGVKKSVFYYEPDSMPPGTYDPTINYKVWSAWNKKGADDVGRSYNYPHVTAAHWVLYRLARYHQGLIVDKNWQWYLENAFNTSMAMVKQAPYYAQFGQMEGTIFLLVLKDLKAEGMQQEAQALELTMKARADHWRTLNYPFGSEMPWDSTGQEEVYMWSDYFGYDDKAAVTLSAILAYMPTVPHWAYNGNARRYWDFLYGGKIARVERQIHHYGSALNAIPVLKEYRKHPNDLYLLRVGYGGLMGSIANVTKDGFGPSAFHSYPSTLANDALSGDYGSGFFGYAINTSSYIIKDNTFGWLSFGGNLTEKKGSIILTPTTAAKSKVFIAPAQLWLTLDAGRFSEVSYNINTKTIQLKLASKDEFTPKAFLRLEQGGESEGAMYSLKGQYQQERGAYIVPLGQEQTSVELGIL
ncbi:DUF5695 domain-containing protein [Olivibacter domesticus]|uniref:Uncharacterized protein n=1 Tax=Olivibacter domesticus TaxID=407022 RepID=A0A1H7TNP2_OLID1|nr:DUF5695 domain-containing protein [Olivibacter domesticus]SEL86313.1 hypothetical protein SAMN05661044_03616 [Olivibacter domesticus]